MAYDVASPSGVDTGWLVNLTELREKHPAVARAVVASPEEVEVPPADERSTHAFFDWMTTEAMTLVFVNGTDYSYAIEITRSTPRDRFVPGPGTLEMAFLAVLAASAWSGRRARAR